MRCVSGPIADTYAQSCGTFAERGHGPGSALLRRALNPLSAPPPSTRARAVCQSYPRSDLVILSHQEQDYYCASQFEGAAKTSSR